MNQCRVKKTIATFRSNPHILLKNRELYMTTHRFNFTPNKFRIGKSTWLPLKTKTLLWHKDASSGKNSMNHDSRFKGGKRS